VPPRRGREDVTEAIVTVPAYFDDVQRQATKDAGVIAGLNVRALLNEPTAAALALGLNQQKDQRVAVFDLGGGTFDISILKIEKGVFEVLAVNGDTFLGGDDFDRRLIDALAAEVGTHTGFDVAADPMALQRLREAAEQAKIELSSAPVTDIKLPFLGVGPGGPVHFARVITRAELDSLCKELVARLEGPCREVLRDAGLRAKDIDQVVLVGGMTRMPLVEEKVDDIFGRKPSKGVNPDEIVAVGAAVQSAILRGELKEVMLLDVTPRSLGIKVAGDRLSTIIPRNTTVPTRERKIFSTTQDGEDSVAVEVYQGENPHASSNRLLGRFVLGELPPRKASQVRVEVSFTIDADGILHVAAQELTSGKATSIVIQASSGLPEGEVARLAARLAGERRATR
jgi:molecular chaperone DnaK